MYWPLKNHGCYSVKSRYQMLYKGDEASIPIPDATRRFWKGIWRFQVPRKIKHFMWKACHNALPTKVNLVRQKILEVNTCQNCDRCPKSITHALWECESIQAVWTLHFRWVNRAHTTGLLFEKLIRFIRQKLQAMELFATTAWYIQCRRNKLRYQSCTTKESDQKG